jgi:hypothetical protein
MRTLKSALGIAGALIPIVYCGGLIYYFLDLTGSVAEAEANGLGPTLLGLAVVGLLFCIPLVVKLIRMLIGSGPSASGGRGGDATSKQDDVDADALVARYMARRTAEAATDAPLPHQGGDPAPRPTFGRKVK